MRTGCSFLFLPLVTCFYIANQRIFHDSSQHFHVKGINWYGMETPLRTLDGLYQRDLPDHVNQMQAIGFNTIRVPFAIEGVLDDRYSEPIPMDTIRQCHSCSNGSTSYDVMDLLFSLVSERRMYVILDLHRLQFGISHPLWYNDRYNETDVLTGWKTLLRRYGDHPCLLGVDIYNEPHEPATIGKNRSTDWDAYVVRFIEIVSPLLHNKLFFVNGIQWGQDMRTFSIFPRDMQRYVVMSPHAYGPSITFLPDNSRSYRFYHWDQFFGYLRYNWSIVVDEWGGGEGDQDWMEDFVDYLMDRNIQGSCYWAWNPYSKDVGGYLMLDWQTPVPFKETLLQKLHKHLDTVYK